MLIQRSNRYDYYLVIIIALVFFGEFGGAFQPIRIVSFVSMPFTLLFIYNYRFDKKVQYCISCLGICFLYIFVSLLWTCEFGEGVKEVIYYICHMNLFLLLLYCSYKSTNPVKFVVLGWIILFVLTIPVAFVEIFFDYHLPLSAFDSNFTQYVGGETVVKKFASVTYGNYNGYVVVLCYVSYFLCVSFFFFNRYKLLFFLYVCLLVVLLFNASRGGLLCIALNSIVFLFYFFRNSSRLKMNRYKIISAIILIVLVSANYSYVLFDQILYRLTNVESLYEDTSRLELYYIAFLIILETNTFGAGAGSMLVRVGEYTSGVTALHNVFLEIFVQYGLGIFLFFCAFLINNERRLLKIRDNSSKMFAYSILISLPIIFVIDSGYLLTPSFWVFMASFYIMSINMKSYSYENIAC